ncbi:MAG: hypothetical protein IT166_19315 [Bryobacterales bacterium]|nr:hypothetical protein [Bryobacterales bacterium]
MRKWLRLVPHPYTAADRKAGYRYQISILQAEFSLAQVLDRPVTGRVFFEEVIRENLDLTWSEGTTPSVITRVRNRPGVCLWTTRTRASSSITRKAALRTETTINDTRDFTIGKSLKNLPALRQIGFQANRRLLGVQKISPDCSIGEDTFEQVVRPIEVEGQRAAGMRFGDPRVQALLAVLVHSASPSIV